MALAVVFNRYAGALAAVCFVPAMVVIVPVRSALRLPCHQCLSFRQCLFSLQLCFSCGPCLSLCLAGLLRSPTTAVPHLALPHIHTRTLLLPPASPLPPPCTFPHTVLPPPCSQSLSLFQMTARLWLNLIPLPVSGSNLISFLHDRAVYSSAPSAYRS